MSRRFVAKTTAQLAAWPTASLEALDLVGLLIDGAHIGEHCLIVALGIVADGQKHALGLWDGSTENARVCQDLLANLQSHGVRTDRSLLVILDGSKALPKVVRTVLRAFLRYARYRGDLTRDLVAAVPVVAKWSMPSIPRAIPAASVRQLLASINRQTARGRRDYAIVLLLARLGLRASEVACLELGDLDWESGQITVRGKRGTRAAPPGRCRRGDCRVSSAWATAQYLTPGVSAGARARLWLCRPECDRLRRARRP